MPKDTVLPCADALCRWCDKHYPPVCKAAEQALMSPSEGSTPCSTWRNQSSTAKGYPHQGHGPTETSTEPQLKCIMWDTHTRKDTGKEKKKKKGICIHWLKNYVDMEAFAHKATEKNVFGLKPELCSEAKSISKFSPFLQY